MKRASLSERDGGSTEGERGGDPGALLRTPGPADPCWDSAPWLAGVRTVPAGATWPRIMSLPHPRAVGTYGDEAAELFQRVHRRPPRWWQRLALLRILEHDADGVLVWAEYLGTLSRQGGKSWLLRILALWRVVHGGARWDDQLVLHTGRDLSIVREVLKPAQSWGEVNGLHISRNNLEPGLATGEHMTGSRWIIRAKHAVYGYAVTNALADEVWDVPTDAITEGLEPTMVEQLSPQLGLWSTAHRKTTGLVLERRAEAIAEVFAPVSRLILEWSTPADVPRDDRGGWRMASPHWSPARERLIEKAYRKVLRGVSVDPDEPDPIASFDAQWLNRWPQLPGTIEDTKDEPLLDADAWQACLDEQVGPAAGVPLFVAVDDDAGQGTAAAAAALTADGRVVCGGWRFTTRREAVDWCQDYAEAVPDSLMLVGASLLGDAELEGVDVPVEPAGGMETRSGLPLLRELVSTRRIAHDGASDATAAVLAARTKPGVTGVMLLTETSALLRCLLWTVQRAHRDRP